MDFREKQDFLWYHGSTCNISVNLEGRIFTRICWSIEPHVKSITQPDLHTNIDSELSCNTIALRTIVSVEISSTYPLVHCIVISAEQNLKIDFRSDGYIFIYTLSHTRFIFLFLTFILTSFHTDIKTGKRKRMSKDEHCQLQQSHLYK